MDDFNNNNHDDVNNDDLILSDTITCYCGNYKCKVSDEETNEGAISEIYVCQFDYCEFTSLDDGCDLHEIA